jgi:hypothetical protein
MDDSCALPPASGRRAPAHLPIVPPKQGKPGYQRVIEVTLRSVHILSMGLVLGGIAMGGTHDTLLGPIVATVTSGLLLLGVSLAWGCMHLTQGAGYAFLAKMGLLGLGFLFQTSRLEFYAAATFVTSVGSHMPSAWRHHTLPVFALLQSRARKMA